MRQIYRRDFYKQKYMSTRKRKTSCKAEGKSKKAKTTTTKTKLDKPKSETKKAKTTTKTKPEKKQKSERKTSKTKQTKDETIKRLKSRVAKLKDELAEKSRGIVVIMDQMYDNEVPNVDVYFAGPGADTAWKYACSDAYESGETPVARITVPEPITEPDQGYIKHVEFLHPNGNKPDLRLAAGIASDDDDESTEDKRGGEERDAEISLATGAVIQRGVESESD